MSLPTRANCIVVVLTFNAGAILNETLAQARKVSDFLYVVDSGSTDGTLTLARSFGAELAQRPFSNYGDQRNWAIAQIQDRCTWQLHLDADEVLDDLAVREIRAVLDGKLAGDAFLLRRRDYFLGQELRFSGLNPWHLRLFRSGVARCEDRLYDQHFVAQVPARKLRGLMHDRNSVGLSEWIARHNRWSDLEAEELLRSEQASGPALQGRLTGDPRERTRFLKKLYYRMPGGLRVMGYFVYRYLLCGGVLDGKAGLYFTFFQALWFRMLVDAKLYERSRTTPEPQKRAPDTADAAS